MLREIVRENFIDNILDKVISFGVKHSKYVAKLYADSKADYGGRLYRELLSADIFEEDTLATGYITGVYKTKGEEFIGISKEKLNKGDMVSPRGPLKKFDDLEVLVYILKK